MGNTCYLSAALQCLLHTDALKDIFLGGSYKADINLQNPLGRQGQVADAFADLMAAVWQVHLPLVHVLGHSQPQHCASRQPR